MQARGLGTWGSAAACPTRLTDTILGGLGSNGGEACELSGLMLPCCCRTAYGSAVVANELTERDTPE